MDVLLKSVELYRQTGFETKIIESDIEKKKDSKNNILRRTWASLPIFPMADE